MTHFSKRRQAAAWCVHLLTASGMVLGFLAIVAVAHNNFFLAFICLFGAYIIDGIDGTFARLTDVTAVLPVINGKTIDCVVDFTTYALVPAYIIYAAPVLGDTQHLIPDALRLPAAIIILLTSALYYGKEDMVTPDYYFIGFPMMWNFVAFYLYYVFGLPPMGNFILVVVCAVLHFVPLKFLYPSRTRRFRRLNIAVFTAGGISCFWLMLLLEQGSRSTALLHVLQAMAVFMMAYNFALSIYRTCFDKQTKTA